MNEKIDLGELPSKDLATVIKKVGSHL